MAGAVRAVLEKERPHTVRGIAQGKVSVMVEQPKRVLEHHGPEIVHARNGRRVEGKAILADIPVGRHKSRLDDRVDRRAAGQELRENRAVTLHLAQDRKHDLHGMADAKRGVPVGRVGTRTACQLLAQGGKQVDALTHARPPLPCQTPPAPPRG